MKHECTSDKIRVQKNNDCGVKNGGCTGVKESSKTATTGERGTGRHGGSLAVEASRMNHWRVRGARDRLLELN